MVGKLALLMTVMGLGLVLPVSAAHAAPTKAQFIRQGDALCLGVQRELAPLRRRAEAAKAPESRQWAAAQRLWADQIRIQARFTARLRAVGVPTGDSKARSIVLGLDRGLVLARRVRDTLLRGEVPLLWPLRCRSTSASRCRSTAASRRTASRSAAIPELHVIEPD
jgi:hypothetical protein